MNKTLKNQIIVYMIPTYNEKENIGQMLQVVYKILKKFKKYKFSILVIDDNSPDGTGKLVDIFSKKHKEVLLLSGQKKGLGKAMIRGYNYAIKKLKADIIISNEADFSYNPAKIPYMIQLIEAGYDAVFGGRKLENTKKWPLSRRIIHFIANDIFAKVVAGVNQVEDHNSAFKAFKVKGLLNQINFSNFPKGFSFFNYLTYKVCSLTSNNYEFKTTFTPRTKGVSKMMLGEAFEYTRTCFIIRLEKIWYILSSK